MRVLVLVFVLLCTVLAPAAATAQDAAALRREIEQLQKQLQSVTERLQRLESQPPAPTPVAPGAAAPRPAPVSPVSPIDLARPREPYSLYQQRGAGQLLFDIGVAGDFVGNFTQGNVERAGGGTFAGLENRFFPREIELSLFGQVDPYASAVVRIEAAEEERAGEIAVHLAEAHLTLLTLPFGTQARLGLMRNRFGYTNERHAHDLPWIDRPNAFRIFFGDEGLVEKGLEATIIPDLPFYLEGLVGIFNGDNEDAFGRATLRAPLVTGRVRTFFELGSEHDEPPAVGGAQHERAALGNESGLMRRPGRQAGIEGLQQPQPAPAGVQERAGIRRRHGPHEVMDALPRPRGVDRAVFRPSAPEVAAGGEVLRHELRGARAQRGERPLEDDLRRQRHALEHLARGVVRQNGYALPVDDAAGVRLCDHLVQRGAGLALAVQDRPVHRRAAAVLRQQRPVEVVRPAPR